MLAPIKDDARSEKRARAGASTSSAPSKAEAQESTSAAGRSPEDWLTEIEARLDAGDLAGARALMAEFRRHYPHVEVDPGITARLEP